MLDNTKAQKETLEMFREVGKTKKKPFLAGFPARNKQSPRGSVGNHKRIHLRQNFPKTSGNYLLQHFNQTSSTTKIRSRSSFSKGNVPRRIKIKCSSRRKEILEIVKGHKIPFLRTPAQEKIYLNMPLKGNQKSLVEKEIRKMLEMGTIKKVSQHKDQHAQNQFLSILFLVRKKDEGSHPVMNLKTLNQFVPFMHFKMENLHTLKYMMKEKRLHV